MHMFQRDVAKILRAFNLHSAWPKDAFSKVTMDAPGVHQWG